MILNFNYREMRFRSSPRRPIRGHDSSTIGEATQAIAVPECDTRQEMTRDEQIELADLNFLEANRELARRAGGVVHDEPGLMLYAGGHPLPVLTNGAMRTARSLAPGEAIARANAFFAAQGRGFTWLVRPEPMQTSRPPSSPPGPAVRRRSRNGDRERLADAVPPPGIDLRRRDRRRVADFASVNGWPTRSTACRRRRAAALGPPG
jgi:hypothetical protein